MKQPEILQYADQLDEADESGFVNQYKGNIASKIRRLYEENKAMSETSSQIIADNMRLHEANQAMLEALKMSLEISDGCSRGFLNKAQEKVRAAIAKGEQK